MKPMAMLAVVAASALWISGPADAGERAKADVRCQQTKTDLVYDCTIMLVGRKSANDAIEGSDRVVGVQSGHHQLARFGGAQRQRDRLQIA